MDAKVLDGLIMVDESQLTGEADEVPKGENQKLMSGVLSFQVKQLPSWNK